VFPHVVYASFAGSFRILASVWVGCVDFRVTLTDTAYSVPPDFTPLCTILWPFCSLDTQVAVCISPVKFKAMSGVKNHGNDQGLHWTDQRLFLIGFA